MDYALDERVRRLWWVPLVSGIIWILASLILFRFDVSSVKGVGIIAGIVFIVAGIEEIATMGSAREPWKWLHAILGILLLVGGVVALANPVNTFLSIAALVGWLLLIKGIFDIILALSNRSIDLWWLRLVVGIVEIALAAVVSGNPVQKAVFLIAFVAAAAMFRGVANIALAFQIRSEFGTRS